MEGSGKVIKQEIEYVISKKIQNNAVFYLVKWKNQQHFTNSWVNLAEINRRNQQDLVYIFENKREDAQTQKKNASTKTKRISKGNKQNLARIIKIDKLTINIPIAKKSESHWIFGDRVEEVLWRDDRRSQFRVRWENKSIGTVKQIELIRYDPLKLCLFFQKQLNICLPKQPEPLKERLQPLKTSQNDLI